MKKHLFLIFITITWISCSKEESSDIDNNTDAETNIYYFTSDGVYLNNTKISNDLASVEATLDGRINSYSNSTQSFFKNGIPKNNVNAPFALTCYFVDGTDIYEGGYELQTVSGHIISRATYWKNGVKMPLEFDNWSDEIIIHEITNIKKFNGVIYLCGLTKISNAANVPPYNVLWKNGAFDYTANYSRYIANNKPIIVNGKLIYVSKETNGNYNLNLENGSGLGSNWFDQSSAFTYLSCEYNGTAYTVCTRIYNDKSFLFCRTGDVALQNKYARLSSCTYNGKDEYICIADGTNGSLNIVYKNGMKMDLPAIFKNINIYKIIAK